MFIGDAMSELPWFKFYTEALNDPKFDVVANDNGMQTWEVLGIWTAILCIASNSPDRGSLVISDMRGLGIKDLKAIIKWDDHYWDNTEFQDFYHFENIIQSFIELDMLTIDNLGIYKIKNFEERQETKDERIKRLNRERQSRYQQSHKLEDSVINNVINNAGITQDSISTSISTSISNSLIKDSFNEKTDKQSAAAFEKYEKEIGLLTPIIADKINLATEEYTDEWICKSIDEAVVHNARNWAYCEAILKRWKVEGFANNGKGKKKVVERSSVDARERYGGWEQ